MAQLRSTSRGGEGREGVVVGVQGTKLSILTNIFAGATEIMPVFKKVLRTHTHTHTRTLAHTHPQTHVHTHTHTHTHTRTHTQLYVNRFK